MPIVDDCGLMEYSRVQDVSSFNHLIIAMRVFCLRLIDMRFNTDTHLTKSS